MCATSHAFESAFVHLQIQASLPVSSAVGGKFIHGGKIYMSPSYFELFAFVFNAFTIVCFHGNLCNKSGTRFMQLELSQ